jgi:hypothetical protein
MPPNAMECSTHAIAAQLSSRRNAVHTNLRNVMSRRPALLAIISLGVIDAI